jgi:hypothetical protein
MYVYLGIELVREFLRFGIPYLMNTVDINLPNDPIAETLIRRIFRIFKVITQQQPSITCQQLLLALIAYHQKDSSEAFNEDDKNKLIKCFKEFHNTAFVYESDTGALTIFFPSFIIRFSNQGLQVTSDDAIKLIKNNESNEVCSICLNNCDKLSIKLKCGHLFCQKCIFPWLNLQYVCPNCRAVVH